MLRVYSLTFFSRLQPQRLGAHRIDHGHAVHHLTCLGRVCALMTDSLYFMCMRLLPIADYLPTLRGLLLNALNREAIYPFYASFKVTSRCHFGCPFCNVKNEPVAELAEAAAEEDEDEELDEEAQNAAITASLQQLKQDALARFAIARAQVRAGRPDAATRALRQARDAIQRHGIRVMHGDLAETATANHTRSMD